MVVLYTPVGELNLDGEGIFFHETVKGEFTRTGSTVDVNGRRLLGVTQVIGLFDLREYAFEGSGLEDDEMPRMPGNEFNLVWDKIKFCDGVSRVGSSRCSTKVYGSRIERSSMISRCWCIQGEHLG